MATPKIPLTPSAFCDEYLKALILEGQNAGTFQKYKGMFGDGKWTEISEDIAKKVIDNLYSDQDIFPKWKSQKEYFKIDIIGYLTNWDNPHNIEKQHDWELKLAYEHENNRDKWHDELCKLCHIVADLKVLISYHDFKNGEPIEKILGDRIKKLGIWRIHRIPRSEWLFIFGPSSNYDFSYRAFTVDTNLDIVELESCRKQNVVPLNWK